MLSELALQKIQRINCNVCVTLRDIEIDTLKFLLAKCGAAIFFCIRSLARAFFYGARQLFRDNLFESKAALNLHLGGGNVMRICDFRNRTPLEFRFAVQGRRRFRFNREVVGHTLRGCLSLPRGRGFKLGQNFSGSLFGRAAKFMKPFRISCVFGS